MLHKLLLQQSVQQLAKQLLKQLRQHTEVAAADLVAPAAMLAHQQVLPALAAASDCRVSRGNICNGTTIPRVQIVESEQRCVQNF